MPRLGRTLIKPNGKERVRRERYAMGACLEPLACFEMAL
jgi:hypothetical protein